MAVQSPMNDNLFNLELIRSYVDVELNPRFVERHWLKQQVEDKLADPDCRFILLTAEPGAGKSAFIAWLAHKHSNWCRYFIRRDQRTPFGDHGSHSFLLQVGFQLAANYPDLFNQKQIEITVKQRIGKASETTQVVGADIGKYFASPFYQTVINIQQEIKESQGEVSGIRIGELYADDRSLPLTNLQFMALFDPAITMLRTNPKCQIIVLIDALDELRYRDTELTILKWLEDCPELLSNLRFILTSRPDDDLLRNFRKSQQPYIRELKIEEDQPDVAKDLSKYINLLVENKKEVKESLTKINQDVATFKTQAVNKAHGNFGYLDAIGRGIDQAISLNQPELLEEYLNLSQLPENLQDLYAFFLQKLKSAVDEQAIRVTDPQTGKKYFLEVWSEIYQPILGILSIALEPLTLEQIQRLGDIPGDWNHLVAARDRLRQFLDQIDDCYRLYHSTLPEFFTSPETKANTKYDYCYVDAVQQNQCIVNYYQAGAKSWAEVDLKKIAEDDYGRRYLAQHLVNGERVEELHALLRLEKDERNAWFNARKLKNDTLGFLNDVRLAWQMAEKAFATSQSSQSIVLQCRYALITSSINRLTGKLRTELVIELARRNLDEGWAYFQQMVSKQNLELEILSKLERQTPESEFEKKVLQHVEKISDKSYQILVKSALAQYYRSELSDILETVKIIKEKHKFQALKMLVPHLPWDLDQLKKILEVKILDQYLVKLLSMLPQYFPKSEELLEKVFMMSQSFDRYKRGDVLIGLAPYLSNKLLKQALNRALDDENENEESQALSFIALTTAPCLNEYFEKKIREKAESYKNPYSQTLVLNALLISLTDQLDKAQLEAQLDKILQKVQTFKDEDHKANILSQLASRLSLSQLEEILGQILQKVQTFEKEYNKGKVLSELGSRLPSNQLEQVQQLLQTFEDEDNKVSVLEGIVNNPNLTSELIKKIQKQAENFDNKDNKVQVFSALIMHLSEKERETYFPTDLLVSILEEAQTIEDKDDNYQTNSIRYLLAQLPQQVRGFEEIKTLNIEYYQDLASKELISCLPSDQLDKILQDVENLEHQIDKCLALSGIAVTPNLEPVLIQKIQQQIETFQPHYKVQVLSALSQHFGEDSERINKILKEIEKIKDNLWKAQVLSTLASYLPLVQLDKVLDKFLQEIQTLDVEYRKVQVLSRLAFRISRLSSDQTHNRLYEKHKEQVIITLAKSDQLNKIPQNIQVFESNLSIALAWSAIVPHLALDRTQEVLKMTQAIEDTRDRANIFRVLALELAKFPCDRLHPLWGEMLHILASRDRSNLLSDFRELTPVISKLGTDEAIAELCHVIKDIGRQFP